MKKKGTTAKELLDRLNIDPEWVAMTAEKERKHNALSADNRRAQTPLLADLCSAGYDLLSVWDLVNTSAPYSAALPVLLEHLQKDYPPAVKEGIARALAVPEARIGWDIILSQYHRETSTRVRSGLAVAISKIANDELFSDVVELLRDKRNGSSRMFFLIFLEKSRKPEALGIVKELDSDPELHTEVQNTLRKINQRKNSRDVRRR